MKYQFKPSLKRDYLIQVRVNKTQSDWLKTESKRLRITQCDLLRLLLFNEGSDANNLSSPSRPRPYKA